MRIIDSGQIDPLIAANDSFGLIEQHLYSHSFKLGKHLDRVVIAEHTVNRVAEMSPHARHTVQGCLERSESLATIVAGHDAQVVAQTSDEFDETPHRALVHIHVHVADVKYGDAVKQWRQIVKRDLIVRDANMFRIPAPAPIETAQLQCVSNDRMDRLPN